MPKDKPGKELRFKQIAVAGGAVPIAPSGGFAQIKVNVYGLTEDGKVYILGDNGWVPLKMNSVEKD